MTSGVVQRNTVTDEYGVMANIQEAQMTVYARTCADRVCPSA